MNPETVNIHRRRLLGAGIALPLMAGVWPARVLQAAANPNGILGQPAPPLAAQTWIDANGEPTTFDMAEIRGRWTLVECFQSWCPACRSHGLPDTARIAELLADEPRVALIGIQTVFEGFEVNTAESLPAIQMEYGLPIKMGHDPGDPNGNPYSLTMQRYRTGGTPWAVVINPQGVVVFNDYFVNVEGFVSLVRRELG